jgi:type II secretory ATPase GspE/PulE/Tfp pilus assembly ATPase PilB-like protein
MTKTLDLMDHLITAPWGILGPHCSEQARNMVAIFNSGKCYLVKGGHNHAEVASIMALAKLKGITLDNPSIVDAGTIRGLYHTFQKKSYSSLGEAPPIYEFDDQKMRDHIYSILSKALEYKGISDLFIRHNHTKGGIWALIDGQMKPLVENSWSPEFARQFIRATMAWAGMGGSAERGYQEGAHQVGQISNGLPKGLQSVRLQKDAVGFSGETLIIRLMPTPSEGEISLDKLRFDDRDIQQFESMIYSASGIIIVTGPTGAGKTTTLHAFMNRLLKKFPGDHWVTVEDPIEIRIYHENVDQIDCVRSAQNDDIAGAYRRALEAALRSAPHRLLFGEIRSEETAQIAVRAALTGHQVLTTLHTEGCLQVIPRLLDLGISKSVLKNQGILKGISSQRLIRQLCPHCSLTQTRSQWIDYCPEWLEDIFRQSPEIHLANPLGCSNRECRNGFIIGRRVIAEIMQLDETLIHLLLEGHSFEALRHWRAKGGIPLIDKAKSLVMRGELDPYEVIRCLNS